MISAKAVAILLLAISETCFGYVSNLLHPYSKALIKLGDYDSSARPPGLSPDEDGPANVSINFFVRSIERIDHMKNEFEVQITFREEWVDSRLSFTDVDAISTNEVQMFWKPDVFFSNERTGHFHSITKPNAYVRLHQNGEVLFSSRITLNLNCPMNLWKFPFDSQRCEIRMASYGYTTRDLNLDWKDDNPVQVSQALSIPGFTFQRTETSYCHSKTNTGDYSCLLAFFEFKRNNAAYVIRVYIPLFLLVIASWTSFWLPVSKVAMRISIGLISSLTTALLIFREADLLHLPVLTSLDVWVGVSGFFVFAAFFEYVLIVYQDCLNIKNQENIDDPEGGKSGKVVKFLWIVIKPNESAIDAFSKVAFSVSYVLFNLLFLSVLF